jgi:hypothetical protein
VKTTTYAGITIREATGVTEKPRSPRWFDFDGDYSSLLSELQKAAREDHITDFTVYESRSGQWSIWDT